MELPAKRAFFDFIKEREAIRLRRQAGRDHNGDPVNLESPLWTADPILAEYKFTNVRRRHDFTSKMLRDHLYEPHFNATKQEALFNCAKNRYFGRFETCQLLGWSQTGNLTSGIEFDHILGTVLDIKDRGDKIFTGAYVITNQGIRAPKEEVVIDVFLKGLWKNIETICEVAESTRSWQKTCEALMKVQGFGGTGFMAKETLLDTMMTGFWGGTEIIEDWKWRATFPVDYGAWTPVGPGGLRGAARVAGDDSSNGLSQPKAKEVIQHLTDSQMLYWPKDWGLLSPTDIQFQLCEFDKYERVRLGQGRPRSKFKPRKQT